MFVIMKSPSLLVDEAINLFLLLIPVVVHQKSRFGCCLNRWNPIFFLLQSGHVTTFFFGSIRNFPKQRPGTPQKKAEALLPHTPSRWPNSWCCPRWCWAHVQVPREIQTRSLRRLTTFSLGYDVDTSLWWYSVLTTMVVSICKYDSFNYCIQTMNEQCRIEYCKIMKPWWYNGI